MIVLSGSLLDRGAPYRDPLDIPREFVHNSSTHLTFSKFWRRYGKFSRHLMKVKLKKYTKFLFVRDPFVRLISAFRSKFELENEEFYRKFAVPMLRAYANHTSLPASVREAFGAGLRVSSPSTEPHRPGQHKNSFLSTCWAPGMILSREGAAVLAGRLSASLQRFSSWAASVGRLSGDWCWRRPGEEVVEVGSAGGRDQAASLRGEL
ncbi:Carbohydrate sulfotransferase 12 [Myotis davidii]|uniref:Carbohydrate sulfotransferase n=2 Tax=Myotis davidii TaxID=225400 RepID=L5LSK4_MYODS|nr:Carbohydrate sulfotransferase 12 [Myotis davidii]